MKIWTLIPDGEKQSLIATRYVCIYIYIYIYIYILGNTLILVALRRESSLHPPSKLLFHNLATTDLCVGLVAEPLNVAYWMSLVYDVLASVSILTLTAISVDRLLALLLGLRYKQVVTLKRTYAVVTTFWVVSCVVALLYLASHRITVRYGRITIVSCDHSRLVHLHFPQASSQSN